MKKIIHIVAGICFVIFVITKVDPIMKMLASRDYAYGNLYDFSKIRDFKIALPPAIMDRSWITNDIQEADILLIGDSFSEVSFGHQILPQMLGEKLQKKVHHLRYKDLYLEIPSIDDLDMKGKIVLIESTERFLQLRFESPVFYDADSESSQILESVKKNYGNVFTQADRNYNYFIDHNNFLNTIGLNEFWATTRFKFSQILPATTPRFSLDPKMLFYHESVNHFYKEFSHSKIEVTNNGISAFFEQIKKKGGNPILIPIPEKFTIYHQLAGESKTDMYLTHLQNDLVKRNIDFVDFHSSVIAADEILYWQTDTHLNGEGFHLLSDLIAQKLGQ